MHTQKGEKTDISSEQEKKVEITYILSPETSRRLSTIISGRKSRL